MLLNECFAGCTALTRITLPSTMYSIYNNAFTGCTNLAYISSAGLRIFLGILQNVQERGVHVYIKGLSDALNDVFTITGFSNIFEFI